MCWSLNLWVRCGDCGVCDVASIFVRVWMCTPSLPCSLSPLPSLSLFLFSGTNPHSYCKWIPWPQSGLCVAASRTREDRNKDPQSGGLSVRPSFTAGTWPPQPRHPNSGTLCPGGEVGFQICGDSSHECGKHSHFQKENIHHTTNTAVNE